MEYQEHRTPIALQRYVECIWELRDRAPVNDIQTIYPDGRCELVAEFGAPLRLHHLDGNIREGQRLVFAGQQCGPIRLQASGPVHCIGVRLMPAASALVAGSLLPELRDAAPDLREFDPDFADAFDAAARDFAMAQEHHGLWRLLLARCQGTSLDARVEQAIAIMDAQGGDIRITDVAKRIGLGMRSLQGRFLAAVGMTAKEYGRVRRLRALLQAFDDGDASLAQLAADRGFADQAHAGHDVRRLTGTTPARLLQALRNNREGELALRLAAAFIRGRS